MSELVTRLDSRMNPILIKELRQSVKGRGTVIVMNLALVILLGAMFIMQGSDISIINEQIGRVIFTVIQVLLSAVCYLIIPTMLYLRTSSERNPEEPDLMFITNMTATQIILGKYATGLTLLLFNICLTMPFMAFSYLFKGIDIISILSAIGILLLISFSIVQGAIMVGSLPMKKGMVNRIMGFAIGLIVAYFGIGITVSGSSLMSLAFGGITFGDVIFGIGIFILMFNIPIFLFSIAMLRPATTNRSLAIRLYLTCLWPVLLLVLVYYKSSGYGSWFAYFYSISQLSLIMSLSARDEIGIRLRRLVPQGLVWRNLSFLLYGGSAGGIVWSLLLLGATLVVSMVAEQSRIMMSEKVLYANLTTAMMVTAYSLLTWFVSRKFFPNKNGAIVSVFAFVAMMIVSVIVTIAREMMREFPDVLLYISPMGSLLDFQPAMPGIAAAFMIFSLILVLPFFIRQYAAFKPIPLHKEVLEQL